MPDSCIHQQLTREALEHSAIALESSCAGELIREYCLYPDSYFGRRQELQKYQVFTDQIQFHYLPDTPWSDVYRYWGYGEDGKICKVRPFRNENFIHADNGFRFLMTRCVEEWKQGNWDEGCRYLGTLLHTLEDSIFGPHTLEGPHGVDFFALNRLSGEDLVTPVCKMKPDQEPLTELADDPPRLLGRNVDECSMRLYALYVEANNSSRHCCFREAVRHFTGNLHEKETLQDCHTMRINAVRVCADVIKSCYALATGEGLETVPERCYLSELEPVEFPFNGAGAFRFKTMQKQSNTLQFGIQGVVALTYSIAKETFRKFETILTLEGYTAPEEISCKVFLDDKIVQEILLTGRNEVKIDLPEPGGMLAFRFNAKGTLPGCIVLKEPCLLR